MPRAFDFYFEKTSAGRSLSEVEGWSLSLPKDSCVNFSAARFQMFCEIRFCYFFRNQFEDFIGNEDHYSFFQFIQ
jgi:hypothetical protein